ncbi:replication-relaxation family protein [Streptomyces sp. A5-4]|uniref:replication-relaxation family protein n=1 Tax=Streptomyces sp. A5-4 TaxID=3384771 RepID=UPI003DAA3791
MGGGPCLNAPERRKTTQPGILVRSPSGAPHARKVTDTVTAFLQPVWEPTRPVVRKSHPPRPVPAQTTAVEPARPAGLGTLAGWETEVVLPVSGTFTTPVKGSPRADAVLAAPDAGLPVLFVEVDNGTEVPQIVAGKIGKYRRFFRRTVKDTNQRDIPMWRTLYSDHDRVGYPPLAIVFTKQVGPEAMMNRMKAVRDLAPECWKGHWQGGSTYGSEVKDGYRDYDGTVPVIVTTLARLSAHGPHGPIWWRYGHSSWETLEAALDNPDDHRAFHTREEERRAERRAQEQREEREREETTRRRKAAAWACGTCGRDVYPSDGWQSVPPGSDCTVCTHAKERERRETEERAAEEAQAKAEAEAWRKENGIFGFLRR